MRLAPTRASRIRLLVKNTRHTACLMCVCADTLDGFGGLLIDEIESLRLRLLLASERKKPKIFFTPPSLPDKFVTSKAKRLSLGFFLPSGGWPWGSASAATRPMIRQIGNSRPNRATKNVKFYSILNNEISQPGRFALRLTRSNNNSNKI